MTTKILWTPANPKKTRMYDFISFVANKYNVALKDYFELHAWSVANINLFWQSFCEFMQVKFTSPPTQIVNDYNHMLDAKWFEGATFNFAEKLLQGAPTDRALICINEAGDRKIINYQELRDKVAQCAHGLIESGVQKGDRIAAVLANNEYPVIAMLATATIGAIWSSCSPDFGTNAILERFKQLEPKVLFINDGHYFRGKTYSATKKINEITKSIISLQKIVICPIINEHNKRGVMWDDFLYATANIKFADLPFSHPLYILFSSGTTGKPKCIIHGAGGTYLQHLKELALHCDISANDTLFFFTTCGWMMWNWMVSALSLGATVVLYDGSPFFPEPDRLCNIICEEQVTVFGCGSKVFSAMEKAGLNPKQTNNFENLRLILATASPLLEKNYDFVYQKIKKDVQLCSISGGTDIISCFAIGNPMLPIYRGELQCLGLGMDVAVFNDNEEKILQTPGELVCCQPFPSMPIGFWNDEHKEKYKHAYFNRFPTVWAQGDRAEITKHMGLIIYGRSDATLNPGGVRIGSAEIYRQVETVNEVVDSVVIGQAWDDDVRIVLFVKLQPHVELNSELSQKIKQVIRENASPRHVPAVILAVPDIPKTISGKTVEIAVRNVVHGKPVDNLNSLANPDTLTYFKNRAELL